MDRNMTDKVTNLTYEALKSIVEYQEGTTQYCVQILQIDSKDDVKSGNLYSCICSDGFAKMNIHILNLSSSIIANIQNIKPIIKILELKMTKQFYLVINHEVLYLDKFQVGKPLDYQEDKRMVFIQFTFIELYQSKWKYRNQIQQSSSLNKFNQKIIYITIRIIKINQ